MKEYQELTVWQKAYQLALAVYRATTPFPREELFGLTSQIRRAAISIPSNIAEGHGRFSDPDFHRFCRMALGSLCELECQLLLARDLGFLSNHEELQPQIRAVKQLLYAFMRSLHTAHGSPQRQDPSLR